MKQRRSVFVESQAGSPPEQLKQIKEMIQPCIQCGTCTGSCPNEFAMDFTPRHLWRLILMGEVDNIFESKTFSLCTSCYYCTLRCPRELKLTEVMSLLKQIAYKLNLLPYRSGLAFYKSFMNNVRKYGRVREAEMMTGYFLSLKNPLLPLKYTPLGLKLMVKRKIPLYIPSFGSTSSLETIFSKVERLEGEE